MSATTYNLRTFYTLLLTQTFSLIGSRMTALAVGIWVFNETGSATPLSLVAFFTFLPRLVSAGVAGVLSDRWDRRYIMIVSDTGQAIGTALLLISVASGGFQLWHLYAVTILQATFDIFQGPAFQASVTMLVPDAQRSRANAMQLLTNPASGIIAPAITGALYAALGLTGIIALDLLTFLGAITVVLLIRIPRPQPSAEALALRGSFWQELRSGFQYVWSRRPLLMIFVFTSSTNFFMAAMIVLLTPYVLARTGSEAALGMLLSLFSLGSLAGSLVMAAWGGTRRRIHTMMPALALSGLAVVFFSLQRAPLGMAFGLFWWAFFPPMNNTSILSILQLKVPPDLQGRVFATISQISMLLIPLSYLIVGPLADGVFELAVRQAGWGLVEPLVGSGPGAGMALLLLLGGAAVTLIAVGFYLLPVLRTLEETLPDYAPAAAPGPQAADVNQAHHQERV